MLQNCDRSFPFQCFQWLFLIDPNVDIIYVSPVPIGEELDNYYLKLLGLRSAVQNSDPTDVEDMSQRFTIIVPEALGKFPVSILVGALTIYLVYSLL